MTRPSLSSLLLSSGPWESCASRAAGVLLNTGIAGARDPLRMAVAMRQACEAGRQAYLAGRIPRRLYANASSPEEGLIEEAGPARS